MSLSRRTDAASKFTSSGRYTPEAMIVITCATISLYNGIELLLLILTSSRRHNDLFSWSLAVASIGVLPYATGWLVRYFDVIGDVADLLINDIGWILLTTGQALVLYSRLNLLVKNVTILKVTKWMIILNAIIWHTTVTVLLFAISTQQKLDRNGAFIKVQKVQLAFFCAQNFLLSGLYIWKTMEIIKRKEAENQTTRIIWHLFAINVGIVLVDVTLLAVGFTNNFLWQQGIKAVAYSVKLKVEFAILGKLRDYVHKGGELIGAERPMFGFVEMEPEPPSRKQSTQPSATPEATHLERVRKQSNISAAESSRNREFMPDEIVTDQSEGIKRRTLDKGKSKCMDDCCNTGVSASK
ncbi:uncharacterized protein BKA55DRAFT_535016 [Fusarium redolens]|uniref:DUF7703 domain-containing protein n=1 Tax=Fusarium redolens TaxID=48865 RepID=A0A9P9KKG6_FUSRE|nr:uncharacterized protein BKA55DRAFT_535016 [Fusarium redolens]KAH7265063.1 hypothetical protein BKA55DRAFT_535016 [Fusarium redolens]